MKYLVAAINVIIALIIMTYNTNFAQSPIVITKNELPSKLGTTWTTLNDTTKNVIVDVGSPGENQKWYFTQLIDGIEIKQTVVSLKSTPFSSDFPESDFVIKYESGLLDIIYSGIFPQVEGDVYFYQQITDTAICLLGTGFHSSFISGSAIFEPPNVILNFLPTQYNDAWTTKSVYKIVKDTTIMGISGQLKLTVNDSAYSIIDAWGKIFIPLGEFDCLRMKSYVTMNERVTFNDNPVAIKRARIINYNWIAEDYGLIMRVASHTDEQDDNFTNARLYSRMTSFIARPIAIAKQMKESNVLKMTNFNLFQNYPNPFNPKTSITYQLSEDGRVVLKVFNLLGQEVKTLVNEIKKIGIYDILWNGENNFGIKVPSGIYIYRMEFHNLSESDQRNFIQVRKMTLIR